MKKVLVSSVLIGFVFVGCDDDNGNNTSDVQLDSALLEHGNIVTAGY
jgi:uncharacterized protein YcfL